MKKGDPLADLLKQEILDTPSAKFSDQLLQASMNSYRVSYGKRYQKEERLGKVISAILIFFNLMLLVKLKPFGSDSALLIGILAAVIAIFGYSMHYLTRHPRHTSQHS
ncbi:MULTISPECIES: hypothetical protein [Sphingobacterium]|nr:MULTISPECIES: hypothetical protein [Sphingobacterium]QIH31473.1 hypothetical protein G6053_00470 [Sphingobacterium sp. DR205]